MSVRAINDEAHFQAELSAAGAKLVVVDFTGKLGQIFRFKHTFLNNFLSYFSYMVCTALEAPKMRKLYFNYFRCGPCRNIAPLFDQLPGKYPKAVFLKVDVDKCQETAAAQGVSAMPTFIFYRGRAKIDRLQGADINGLETKIKKHYASSEDESGEEYGQGLLDLATFIQKNQCECLNECDDHPFTNALNSGPTFLASDCDEQLIISISFNQSVKIHSLKVRGPQDTGPKHIKLFINQPRTIDFDMGESCTSVQELELTPKDLEGKEPVGLRFVKFQNVQNIQLFIKDNQSGGERTVIEHLAFIGSPIATTKMDEFQRVAGKKGMYEKM
jgi:thiol-disulfide isomerase/thioredoxin